MFGLIATAWADETTSLTQPSIMDNMANLMPIFIMFGIIYFLLIRPQLKKQREHTMMINSLRKGDKVIAAGGIIGNLAKISNDEEYAQIEIAPNLIVEVLKTSILQTVNKDKMENKISKK